MRKMTYEEKQLFYAQHTCPGCRQSASHYILGPRGGMCINMRCELCGMRVNVLQHEAMNLGTVRMFDGVGDIQWEPEGYQPHKPVPLTLRERLQAWYHRYVERRPQPRRLQWNRQVVN